ncbi:MAG: hypothetical protein IPO27_12125 [Bacteroidetes bacterium]|nr:hypothetical protein [Bacteroidota bacterium]
MKKIFVTILFAGVALSGFGQLSTRSNDNTVEPLGARPQKGDMALTFGADLTSLFSNDSVDKGFNNVNSLGSGAPISIRYYLSDNVAFRGAIRLYKENNKFNGSSDSTTQVDGGSQNFALTDREFQDLKREYVLIPGIQKHFSPANMFDVYAGADLHLGFRKELNVDNSEFANGDYNRLTRTTNKAVIGLGGVIGFNVFIAHLPVSLGMEYGWTAKWTKGGKTENEKDVKSGTDVTTLTYFTQSDDENSYKDLKRSSFDMDTNQDVRLILSIYFSRN